MAKEPAGVLNGNFKWYGDFGECRSISPVTMKIGFNNTATFGPRFCRLGVVSINSTLTDFDTSITQYYFAFMFGLCVTNHCSELDLQHLFNPVLNQVGLRVAESATYCQLDHVEPSEYFYIACVCFSLVGFLLLVGLCYDFVTRIKGTKSSSPKSAWSKLALGFSPLLNLKKILHLQPSSDEMDRNSDQPVPFDLSSINAIRSLSIFWVILGHIYFFSLSAVDNPFEIATFTKRFTFQFIISALFAVDSFFFLSGFLAYYALYKRMQRKGSSFWKIYLFALFLRYIRLTIPYMLMILFEMGLWPHIGNGPFYYQGPDDFCINHAWTNALYINNYIHSDQMCANWSWYLAVDMQLFIVAPFFVYLLVKSPFLGWLACTLGLVVQITTAATLTVVKNLPTIHLMPLGYYSGLANG